MTDKDTKKEQTTTSFTTTTRLLTTPPPPKKESKISVDDELSSGKPLTPEQAKTTRDTKTYTFDPIVYANGISKTRETHFN